MITAPLNAAALEVDNNMVGHLVWYTDKGGPTLLLILRGLFTLLRGQSSFCVRPSSLSTS